MILYLPPQLSILIVGPSEYFGFFSIEIAVTIELAGPTPLAGLLRRPDDRAALGEELEERTGALEVQLAERGVSSPVDRAALRASPTALATALDLLERAAADPALLRELAPAPLAGQRGEDDDAYLRALLEGLDAELIERCLTPPPRGRGSRATSADG